MYINVQYVDRKYRLINLSPYYLTFLWGGGGHYFSLLLTITSDLVSYTFLHNFF